MIIKGGSVGAGLWDALAGSDNRAITGGGGKNRNVKTRGPRRSGRNSSPPLKKKAQV